MAQVGTSKKLVINSMEPSELFEMPYVNCRCSTGKSGKLAAAENYCSNEAFLFTIYPNSGNLNSIP